MKVHGSFGRLVCSASIVPTSVTYLCTAGILHDAVSLTDFFADISAQLDLFFLGDVQVVELLLALLRLLHLAAEAAQLCERGGADSENRDDDDPQFHTWFSFDLENRHRFGLAFHDDVAQWPKSGIGRAARPVSPR